MIGELLMYGAGYILAVSIAILGVAMVGISLKDRDFEYIPGGIFALCVGLFATGALAYNQYPPTPTCVEAPR